MTQTTNRTGLREAALGVFLLGVGFHVAAVFPPLGFGMLATGAYLAYVGVTYPVAGK
jgi:hypothetical protein